MNHAFRWSIAISVLAVTVGGVAAPFPAKAQEASEDSEAKGEQAEEAGGAETPPKKAEDTDAKGEEGDEPPPSDSDLQEADEAEATADQGRAEQETEEESQAEQFQLDELVERAQKNSDLLAEFEAKRKQAQWKEYQAKWFWTPKLKSQTTLAPVPANADPDRVNENFDEIAALNIGPFINEDLDLLIPVYTFGRIQRIRELADVGVDVAKIKKQEAQLNATFQTKRAYYSLRLSRTFAPLLEDGDERIEERLEEMQTERDFGEAEFDIEDLRKLQIFSAEVDSRIADNSKLADIASSGLRYLADLEAEKLGVGKIDEESEPPQLESFQYYYDLAKEHRPDLKKLDHAVQARRLQFELEKKNLFPNIAFTGRLGIAWSTKETRAQPVCRRQRPDGPCIDTDELADEPNLFARPDRDPLSKFSLGVAFVMEWNLDIVRQHGKIQEKKAQYTALQAQRRRAMGAIKLDIRKKYNDAADALQKIEINDRRLTAARRWRDQLGFSIETAGAEMKKAIKPLKAYYQAKAKYLEARYNYMVARAALAQAIGVDYLGEVEETAETAAEQGGEPTDGEEGGATV